jgi:hypothetical protein
MKPSEPIPALQIPDLDTIRSRLAEIARERMYLRGLLRLVHQHQACSDHPPYHPQPKGPTYAA